jgi:hypothetical protein
MNISSRLKVCGFVLAGALATGTAAAVPIYNVSDGKLTGIEGIDIADLGTWNVAFVEGTPLSAFGNPIQLAFTNSLDANAATNALKNVFIGNAGQAGWDIDLEPSRTFGCSGTSDGYDYCAIFTPYEVVFNAFVGDFVVGNSVFENFPGEFDLTLPTLNQATMDYDTTLLGDRVWAFWSQATTTVPEPGTFALMGIALLSLPIFLRRRRNY